MQKITLENLRFRKKARKKKVFKRTNEIKVNSELTDLYLAISVIILNVNRINIEIKGKIFKTKQCKTQLYIFGNIP